MKRNLAFQMFVGLFTIFVSCAIVFAQDVTYNYVPGTDFSKYKTYKWVEVEGGEKLDQITDGQVRAAIEDQMTQKGFTKSDTDTADLLISYQVAINQQKEWTAWGGYGGLRWGGGMSTATSSTINVGTLVLDVYEAATKKQLWTGDATKTLNPSKDPEKNLKNLQKAIAKLMKNFPPPVKK